MRRLLWLPLLATMLACPPAIDTGEDGSGIIYAGPEGGLFIREGASIEIPRGALSAEAQITVTVVDSNIPEVTGRKRISMGYRFSPSSLVFKEPVTISVAYLTDRVPKGVDPATFDVRRWTEVDPYLQLPSPNTLPEFQSVRARTDRLGLFWATSPEKPAVNEVVLTPEEANLRPGETAQFTAQVTDPAGNPLPDVEVKYSLVPARVASVDATGLVTALQPGTATLTAQAGEVTVTAPVRVIGDTVGPTSFIHENPFPTGNNLHGGGMLNGVAFFVGGNGTLLTRSPTNAWTRHFSNPGITLKAAGGGFPAGGVAVGISGTSGVLVEITDATSAPTVKTFPTVEPRALWYDGTHGVAVGQGNDVIMRRNGDWVTVYSPSFETLLDVVGDGQGGFTTVGSRGSLYQYDPATMSWNSLYDTQLNVLLTDAVLANANGSDAWAVGANKLWRFTGAGWTSFNLPATPALDDLTAVGRVDGKIVVAGIGGGDPWLLLYEPLSSSWTTLKLRRGQVIRNIFGDGATAYAVGDVGAVWQYGSGVFTELSSGFYGDVADVYAAPGVAVAVVNECANAGCTSRIGKVLKRSAEGRWEELGAQVFTGPLFSVAVQSESQIFVGAQGAYYRYDGQAWSAPISLGTSAALLDMTFCGDDLYAVGTAGAWFRGKGALLAQSPLGNLDLYSVSCQGLGEVWMAGDMSLYRLRANSANYIKDPGVNHAAWRTVWSPAQGEAYVFGDSRWGVYWNTAHMLVYDAPGGVLPDIISSSWGSSVDNLYAVGYTLSPVAFGYAARFNGGFWNLIDAGSERPVTSIHGSSATDVYLTTRGGGILKGVVP